MQDSKDSRETDWPRRLSIGFAAAAVGLFGAFLLAVWLFSLWDKGAR